MYADDTTLSSTIDSFNEDSNKNITSEINNELSKFNEWLKINKFSLNKSKTKYMISKKTAGKHCKAHSTDIWNKYRKC